MRNQRFPPDTHFGYAYNHYSNSSNNSNNNLIFFRVCKLFLSIPFFTCPIITEGPLCAGHCAKNWRNNKGQNQNQSLPFMEFGS